MNYEKLAEVSQMVAKWKKIVDSAKTKLGQAEADLYTAEKNFASYKRQLDELLKESGIMGEQKTHLIVDETLH